MIRVLSIVGWFLLLHAPLSSAETIKVMSWDGFELETAVALPDGQTRKQVQRVVILLHGSGPQSMDVDLGSLGSPGTTNLFFVDIAGALTQKGFGVVRYHKRSFAARKQLKADASFAKTRQFKDYAANPLMYFVEDAKHYAEWAQKRFPQAKVYLLGHSQGAYIALQVARLTPAVEGVALLGFSLQSLDTSLFEQTVYRSLGAFKAIDRDQNGILDEGEVKKGGATAERVWVQLPVLDLNGDGRIDRSEFMAGNLSNIVLDGPSMAEYRLQEARYPRLGEILKEAKFSVIFVQGEWDNQTPAYNAKAIKLLNNAVWKKPNLSFYFFPRLGHALDQRTSYDDLMYRPIDKEALKKIVEVLDTAWVDQELQKHSRTTRE